MSNLKNFLFTSESVSEGHPDKVSDRISDMVVDTYLSNDPYSRVACETLTTTNKVVLAGEVRGPEIKENDLIEKDYFSEDIYKKIKKKLIYDIALARINEIFELTLLRNINYKFYNNSRFNILLTSLIKNWSHDD